MVIRLTELINNFFRCFDFLCMMCEGKAAVSVGAAVFFCVCAEDVERAYAGVVERAYARDVASVRARLRRWILLRLREPAKTIFQRAELASLRQQTLWKITPSPAA